MMASTSAPTRMRTSAVRKRRMLTRNARAMSGKESAKTSRVEEGRLDPGPAGRVHDDDADDGQHGDRAGRRDEDRCQSLRRSPHGGSGLVREDGGRSSRPPSARRTEDHCERDDVLTGRDPLVVDRLELAAGTDGLDGLAHAGGQRAVLLEDHAHLVDLHGRRELADDRRLRVWGVEVLELRIADEERGLQVDDQAVDLAVLERLDRRRVVVEDLRLGVRADDVLDELEARRAHGRAEGEVLQARDARSPSAMGCRSAR